MIGRESPALETLAEVEVAVSARLGSAHLPLSSVLSFAAGTVVTLDCAPDAPATLLVNGVAIAVGDLVLTDDGSLAVEIREVSK